MAKLVGCQPYGEAAFPTIDMPDRVLEVLEDNGFNVTLCGIDHDEACIELENWTECGGDMLHLLRIPIGKTGDAGAWWREFDQMYQAFDPWERALMECDEQGRPPAQFACGGDLFYDISDYDGTVLHKACDDLWNITWKE